MASLASNYKACFRSNVMNNEGASKGENRRKISNSICEEKAEIVIVS